MRRLAPVRCLAPLASFVVLSCAAEPPPPPPPPAVVPILPPAVVLPSQTRPPPREDGRLPALAAPLHYELSLEVDPNQPRFSGKVRILVQVPAVTSYVVLHGRGLNVRSAAAQVGAGFTEGVPASAAARVSHGGHAPDEIVLTFDRPLATGQAVLNLSFDAAFDDSLAGLYRVKEDGRWYAYTQFEATDARRAFPCFDEPGFKVPFNVSVVAPAGLMAISNMPEQHQESVSGGIRFDFATSPPLPTYLVAVAVGDFEVRAGQTSPLPIRLVTTKGKAHLGGLALEDTAALVGELSRYFHVGYPYPKLDIVAVPNFAAGAMENAGLITFRDELLLLDEKHASQRARMSSAEVIAHELAHQWFGDLVTTAWWNDLWLNEGFASWAQDKVIERWKPSFRTHAERLLGLADVMTTDSLASARAVRQPVRSTGEANEAFDGLTYVKGAAILGMIEHSMGGLAFQRGIESYMRTNAWKAATADDLLHALDQASGKNISLIAASFLDRPGVPVVTVAADCKSRPASLIVTQSSWHLLGATTSANAPAPWIIPLDIRTDSGGSSELLTQPSATAPVAKCPTWISPNDGGFNYYRYALDEKRWTALAKTLPTMDVENRLGFVTNLWAGVRSGGLSPDVLLRLLPSFDTEQDRVVVDAEIAALSGVSHALVTDAARPAFAKYVLARLAPHQHPAAGSAHKGEVQTPTDEALERRALFAALGNLADEPATLDEASRLTSSWLADPSTVDPDLARAAVVLGSRKAGPERIAALRAAMKGAKNPYDRKTAMLALGGFGDPGALDKGLDVVLSDDVPTQDVRTVLADAASHPTTHRRTLEWVTQHWDALRSKLPGFLAGRIFGISAEACTKEEVERMSSFFGPKAAEMDGARRPLEEALEAASFCQTLHDKDAATVDQFFQVKSTPPTAPRKQ